MAFVDLNPKGKRQQPKTIFTQSHGSRSMFQIVLIYHLMQEMTRGLLVVGLCNGFLFTWDLSIVEMDVVIES